MSNLTTLANKIKGYKSFNQAVKDRVLKQFENRTELTDDQFRQASKRLYSVMVANKRHIIKVNRVTKQVKNLEIHTFAPELNTLHFNNGMQVKTPQKTTILEAIDYAIFNNKVL